MASVEVLPARMSGNQRSSSAYYACVQHPALVGTQFGGSADSLEAGQSMVPRVRAMSPPISLRRVDGVQCRVLHRRRRGHGAHAGRCACHKAEAHVRLPREGKEKV
jgi:hypothetical protein